MLEAAEEEDCESAEKWRRHGVKEKEEVEEEERERECREDVMRRTAAGRILAGICVMEDGNGRKREAIRSRGGESSELSVEDLRLMKLSLAGLLQHEGCSPPSRTPSPSSIDHHASWWLSWSTLCAGDAGTLSTSQPIAQHPLVLRLGRQSTQPLQS